MQIYDDDETQMKIIWVTDSSLHKKCQNGVKIVIPGRD